MDDDNNKSLSFGEFKKALREMNMQLVDNELHQLFNHFDTDNSGSVDFEEFIQGIRVSCCVWSFVHVRTRIRSPTDGSL